MIKTDFLHQLERLSLIINKRITSSYTGERRSLATGKGMVFKDYTIYTPGDDFRTVDWKAFARTDKLWVRRYEEERNLTVHVIIDFSNSMNFSSSHSLPTKAEYASMLGLGFAYLALKNNERFVLSTFGEELEYFRAKRGRKQLVSALDHLNNKRPSGKTNFERALAKYKSLLKSRSYIAMISDFLYPPEEVAWALARYRKHEIRLIQVLDPMEFELELEGDYKFRDLETKEHMRTFVSKWLRKQYIAKLNAHLSRLKRASDAAKGLFFSFPTSKSVFDAFWEIVQKEQPVIRR